ncbi:MAG: DUF2062 domain-containing protein [Polyangiaceae bacterium]|nr:DUF2062 domain-containing protein [Myxococcales bacterium]MCB9590074.1 DUF2062 domain-containing protein [Polyangiaceae bacterium]MCB9607953.1 DUF2062 domain-containing protein [Polyangiaceae bacterium]
MSPPSAAPKSARNSGLRVGAKRLYRRLRGGTLTPARAALSVGVGVFIGCLPLYGLHLPLCALVCLPLRLDLVTCYLAANISNPFFAPFLLIAEVELGSRLLHGAAAELDRTRPLAEIAARFASELAVGAPLVGLGLALVFAAIAFKLVERQRSHGPELDAAIQRTVARYASALPKHRYYVRGKLRFDPLTAQAQALKELGHLVDLGCGRGQFALLLLELGVAERVTGYDFDAEKIEVAKRAAAGAPNVQFSVADLAAPPPLSGDSFLVLDVLHYLPEDAQQRLLERITRALPAGGQLMIREASPAARPSSALTRFAERMGRTLRMNRADEFRFVDPAELRERLEALGLSCELTDASEGTPLDNYLIVASRICSSHATESEPALLHEEG